MLCICNLAGKTLATFSADEVEGKSVTALKTSLAKQIGATRFQQKWLAEDRSELHEDAVAPCCDVQLVVVPFMRAEDKEHDQLVSASMENRPNELVDLLRKPLNPHTCEFLQALEWAAQEGHSQIVQLLLEAGVDANDTVRCKAREQIAFDDDDLGEIRTALVSAIENGHSEVVKLLLDVADNNVVQRDGGPALRVAAKTGNLDLVKQLLEAGVEKDESEYMWARTALHFAAMGGHLEVVKLLLEAGADIEVWDLAGKSPWDWARENDHPEVANLLQFEETDSEAAASQ